MTGPSKRPVGRRAPRSEPKLSTEQEVSRELGPEIVAKLAERQRSIERPDFGNVRPLRPAPEVVSAPEYRINVADSNPWRYSTGAGEYPRGGYEHRRIREGDGEGEPGGFQWVPRFELPEVHARVVVRDASGRREAMDYLIQRSEHRAVVTEDDLSTGQWAGKLGIALSVDRTIVAAAGTAIKDLALRAPEVEATPRTDAHTESGHLDIPVPECLPTGYLIRPPRGVADEQWDAMHAVGVIAAERPGLALVMGMSAASPYLGALRRQSFWLDCYGEPRLGKSTALALAASLWGDPRVGTGVIMSWNATGIGPGRHLGQLGILPSFMDERGIAPFTPEEWSQLIFSTCEGNSRLKAQFKGRGTDRSAPWFGVLFSTGNGRLLTGLGAGKFAGVLARVVELAAPFTADAAESDEIKKRLLPRGYGWLGPEVMARYSVAEVAGLIERAADEVGERPTGGIVGTIAECLYLGVAGAIMVDAVLELGGSLVSAAARAAREYLAENGHAPEHDADRMCLALGESLAASRASWPTMADYVAHGMTVIVGPEGFRGTPQLPGHGQAATVQGVRSDDGRWLYVMPAAWSSLATQLGADSTVALRELHERGQLAVMPSVRKQGKWTSPGPRLGGPAAGRLPKVYHLAMEAIEPPELDNGSDPEPPAPDAGPDWTAPPEAPAQVPTTAPDAVQWAMDTEAVTVDCERAAQVADESPEAPAERFSYTGRQALRKMPVKRARETMVREAQEALAAGHSFRPLDMLAESFVPRVVRKPCEACGQRRAATYRRNGEVPGITGAVHTVRGYQWSRPFEGETVTLDRNASYPSAAASVLVTHCALTQTGAIEYDRRRAGYYLVDVFPWSESDRLPSPLGRTGKREQVWLTGPTVELLLDLAEADRWPAVTVLDSWTAPGVRMSDWTTMVQPFRRSAIERGGRDGAEYLRVKDGISHVFGLMRGKDSGMLPNEKSSMYLPDWYHTIEGHSAATIWRRADKCLTAAPDLGPVELRNTDELVIPAEAFNAVIEHKAVPIDNQGIDFGSFKVVGQ